MSKVTEHNALTGKTIVRDMTETEQAQAVKDLTEKQKQIETQEQNDSAKAVLRQAVLKKLGLTADEAAALFG
jgi:antitoxin component of RelBE/YafQ-DinJ toxin-antitoxin module